MITRRPIASGLFVVPSSSEQPYLLGSKCRTCGEVLFPTRRRCRRCTSDNLEEVALSRRGKLYSFTTVRVKLPNAMVQFPCVVGVVELPEGERIRTLLADFNSDSLRIGAEVELAIDVVYKDSSGHEVLGWKFKPVAGKQK